MGSIFTWMDLLDGCFATSSSQLPYSKPCAAVPAAWLFCFSHPYKSELLTSAQNKKARTVRAGFVTPSGFKPETF
jgi:hypothetical protein